MANATAATATFDKIVEALERQRIVAHVDVASATLLLYDIIINLPVEVTHVWKRKWSFLTVLYIFQRYLPIFDVVLVNLHHQFGVDLSPSYCTLNYHVAGWSFIGGVMLSEVILTLRVWAVWRTSIPVAIGLVVFFLACWIPCCILLSQFMGDAKFATLPFPNSYGCFIAAGSPILYVCWILMVVYDTGTLVMILIPGIGAYRRGGRSELLKTIYKDGVIYYAWIFLFSTINVIVIRTLPLDFVHLLTSFERVLHSLLTSRVVLHIRQVLLKKEAASLSKSRQTLSQID